MKRYQVTLHQFNEDNTYKENILARRVHDLTPTIDFIHEKYDLPILLLPNNIENHVYMLETLDTHITIELLQEIY